MNTTFEDRLQLALRDLADDIGPSAVLHWAPPEHARTTWAKPVAVAAVVLALVASTLLVLRTQRPSVVDPVQQPPRVLRLATTSGAQPGSAVLAVTLSGGPSGGEDLMHHDAQSVYLLAGGRDRAVRLSERSGDRYFGAQLTEDGHHLLLKIDPYVAAFDPAYNSRFQVLDLRTEQPVPPAGVPGLCPELSGDGAEVAFHQGSRIVLLNVRTGARAPLVTNQQPIASTEVGCAAGLGWSPDGQLLAVGRPSHKELSTPSTTRVFRRSGELVGTLPGHLVNGSMSWAPDGRSILVYDNQSGAYRVADVDGSTQLLRPPPDASRALGWTGSRVVWLLGGDGDQRLVTTDRTGGEVRSWLRFEVGDALVTDVQWSDDLSGTVR